MTEKPQKQIDKFKEAARELQTDDDEKRFDEKLKRLAKPTSEGSKKSSRTHSPGS